MNTKLFSKIAFVLIMASLVLSACGPAKPSLWGINDPTPFPQTNGLNYRLIVEPILDPRESLFNEHVIIFKAVEFYEDDADVIKHIIVGGGSFSLPETAIILQTRYYRIYQDIRNVGVVNPIRSDALGLMDMLCREIATANNFTCTMIYAPLPPF
jgi:hypothetical protein